MRPGVVNARLDRDPPLHTVRNHEVAIVLGDELGDVLVARAATHDSHRVQKRCDNWHWARSGGGIVTHQSTNTATDGFVVSL